MKSDLSCCVPGSDGWVGEEVVELDEEHFREPWQKQELPRRRTWLACFRPDCIGRWVSQLATVGNSLSDSGCPVRSSRRSENGTDNDVGDTEDFDSIFNGGCFTRSCFAAIYMFA